MSRSLTPTAFLLAVVAALPAPAAEAVIEKVVVGFGGAYRAGEWTPLTFEVGSPPPAGAVVETVTTDVDGSAVARRREARTDGPGSTSVRSVFQSGRLGSDLTVRLRSSDGALLAERRYRSGSESLPVTLPKGTILWVAAGGEKGNVPPTPERATAAALSGLPSDRLGFAAADVLFVRGDLAPTPEQAEEIRAWVAGGGHLAIALGRHTEAYRAGPLAGWVPVGVGDAVQLFDLTRLEAYSRSDRRMPRARRVTVARLGEAAETLLSGPDGGLIARGPYGFGRVTVFAFEFDAPPFSNWVGLKDVLGRALLDAGGTAARGGRNVETGVTDLATQLLRAEETLPGVDRPTTGRALLLLLLYAAVVGPLDYLVVHRVLRRPALTWVTLPAIVFGAAWWLDRDAVAANGRSSQMSRLDLVDVDAAGGTLRGRGFVTLYSAGSTRADVEVVATTGEPWGLSGSPASPDLGWIAPPEETFGGVFRDASGGLFASDYVVPRPGAAARAEGLPLLAGGTRRFASVWQQGDAAALVESDLAARSRGLLEGRVVHRLPGPLVDYVIAFGDRVYEPREKTWRPGVAIEPGSTAFLRRDLSSFLTRAQTKQIRKRPGEGGQDYIVAEGRYDPLSTDVGEVVRMLTFHKAAGGTDYTGLTNVSLGSDDLSSLLDLRRAVVFGRLEADASEVAVKPASGAEFPPSRAATFVRLVLPADRIATEATTGLAPTKIP